MRLSWLVIDIEIQITWLMKSDGEVLVASQWIEIDTMDR